MPEGPELYLSARFISQTCRNRLFSGAIQEILPSHKVPKLSALNKRLSSPFDISSRSRGKELMVTLNWDLDSSLPQTCSIRFAFGMTGCFLFSRADDLPKHAKVCFWTAKQPYLALCFVDQRGFGRWDLADGWSEKRGPCVIKEYPLFRSHVLANLNSRIFNRPICEVMLDQAFFSGVGNYLRAEVLFRCGVRPFESARAVLQHLSSEHISCDSADPLLLCHQLAWEAIQLDGGKRYRVPTQLGDDGALLVESQPNAGDGAQSDLFDDEDPFENWLQCYCQPSMKNIVDRQGRTMWYSGDPGPLSPKDPKSRRARTSRTAA